MFRFVLPLPHYMAFAPLDAWWRMLSMPGARVGFAYIPRLILNLVFSTLATLVTLPERLLLAPFLHFRGNQCNWQLDVPVIIVLGYYRTGTTHLQYLLSCDSRTATPKWFHCLAPQGWVLTWTFVRLFLIPFMGEKRPIDDVAYGPEWPTEDDFANNNWTGTSPLAGRMSFPNHRTYEHTRRFHFLNNLNPHERDRWRTTTWKFLYKLSLISRNKRILLKTPAHTARIAELVQLFGVRNVRFIHTSREPGATFRSNLAINQRFGSYLLQTAADPITIGQRITEEYRRTIEEYDSQRQLLPAGTLMEIRFEDLRADPLSTLKTAYKQLGIEWTQQFEDSLAVYLASVKDFRPNTQEHSTEVALPQELRHITSRFKHDLPAIIRVPPPAPPVWEHDQARKRRRMIFVAAVLPVILGSLWAIWSRSIQHRQEPLVWLVGAIMGWMLLWAVRKGSAKLGLLAAASTLLVWISVCYSNTWYVSYVPNPHPELAVSFTDEIIPETFRQLFKLRMLFWGAVGTITAYRFASRQHVHPLGKDRFS